MLEQLGSLFRKISLSLIFVGLLAAFYTEAFADVPIGRGGKLKPPISQQRWTYLLLFSSGVPGFAWGLTRAIQGKQRTPWE